MSETPSGSGAESLTRDELLRLYKVMCVAAAFEARILKGIRSGEFATSIWPSRGQEAIAGALALALREDDRLVTTYRGLHDHIAKGVPLTELAGEVLGTTAGAAGGKGGPMHIAAPAKGLMMATGIVGSGPPVAAGLALAARKQGSGRVVAVTFGDGATNTGSFHEAMNLAATWRLPMVFVCQNNQFAEMTPVSDTMAIDQVAERAKGVGMRGTTVDGNDPVATHAALREAVERARAGDGPSFVECVTFRFDGHYSGDKQPYMPDELMAEARNHDPLITFPARLAARADISEADLAAIRRDTESEVEKAVAVAKTSPLPTPEQLERDVYADIDGSVVSHA
jgi:pyruvate dehydrogenase E1 component alpha subunit